MKKSATSIIIVLTCWIYLLAFPLFSPALTENQDISNITGFSEKTNQLIESFINRHESDKERKVAIFDFDGTLMGQVPYYAADEFFMEESDSKRLQSKELPSIDGVSSDKSPIDNYKIIEAKDHNLALQWRIQTFSGQLADEIRQRALKFYQAHYQNKIFKPTLQLLSELASHNFEVWIITGTPDLFVDKFIQLNYGVPMYRILGVKAVVREGVITKEPVFPTTDRDGKIDAIDTFIKTQPLLVVGNSMGDIYMLNRATEMALVINPSTQLSEMALKKGWSIENIPDLPTPESTYYYKEHGIQPNK